MKKIILASLMGSALFAGSVCEYHLDELSKSMTKAKLYATNNMLMQAKLALKSAIRHNIEAQAECSDPKIVKTLQEVLPDIKNGIKVNGKSILD